jgi:hypothetical protein
MVERLASYKLSTKAAPPLARHRWALIGHKLLMQFARLKPSQPIEGFGTSMIEGPILARHYQRSDTAFFPADRLCCI